MIKIVCKCTSNFDSSYIIIDKGELIEVNGHLKELLTIMYEDAIDKPIYVWEGDHDYAIGKRICESGFMMEVVDWEPAPLTPGVVY